MIVSWSWLQDYLKFNIAPGEVAERLAMAGLNHEGTTRVGNDLAIDIEITSNRPDCLGHLGIAREIAVLWDQRCHVPEPDPRYGTTKAAQLVRVSITCPELCPRYTARVVQGVKVGPSPQWLQQRLATIGIGSINNIVDITNYVMMECGQPLHAFDYGKLTGQQITVRRAQPAEDFLAIDHRNYLLTSEMCVIADARRAVAIGGVMGGADSEVSATTTDVLIEAADFDPLAVRNASRELRLFSPSSYRFERTIDSEGMEWASRRSAELILQIAGGTLAEGMVDVRGADPQARETISLRFDQVPRVLGVNVPRGEVRRILEALGNVVVSDTPDALSVQAPSWRRDLTREIDLIEEVARIYGYDKIPEHVRVPMATSARSREDRVLAIVRRTLTGAGFDEAMTASVVTEESSTDDALWIQSPALKTQAPMLRGASYLRRSLLPSLLAARHTNESLQNTDVELFEIARVYWSRAQGLPDEPTMLAVVSERGLLEVKGALQLLVHDLARQSTLQTQDADGEVRQWCDAHACGLLLNGEQLGFLGELNESSLRQFELRRAATVAEVRLDVLITAADLVPQYRTLSSFPAIHRDLNLVVDEAVRWADLSKTVRDACGVMLEDLTFGEIFRDVQKDGPGKKRLFFSFSLRATDRTLTREEADDVSDRVVQACDQRHGARLLA